MNSRLISEKGRGYIYFSFRQEIVALLSENTDRKEIVHPVEGLLGTATNSTGINYLHVVCTYSS